MSQFSTSWALSRSRFNDTVSDLNQKQLSWRIHPQSLTIGEMALHVAGVEVSFVSQLTGAHSNEMQARLRLAATDGVVNEKPFPFSEQEITPEVIAEHLDCGKRMVEPLISNPSDQVLSKEIVSALGPVITGAGAFARLAFHAAYHQGQAYLIRSAPGFPAA